LFFFSDFIAPGQWNFLVKGKTNRKEREKFCRRVERFYERETTEIRPRLEDRTIESRALLVFGGGCRSEDRFRARFLPLRARDFFFFLPLFFLVSLSLWFKSLTTISLSLSRSLSAFTQSLYKK
jgi:hypothetical protein